MVGVVAGDPDHLARPAGRTAYRIVAAFDGDDLVGGAELSQPLVHDTETVSVVLGVLPGHRRRGAGALLMTEVRAIAREHGRSILQTEVTVPDGVAFESWCGGAFAGRQGMRSVSAEDRMLVDLPFDPARLDRIVAGVPACRRAGAGRLPRPVVHRAVPGRPGRGVGAHAHADERGRAAG